MGKYDAVVKDLKPLPPDPKLLKYQEKVNEAKSEMTVDKETGELLTLTPDVLVAMYARLRYEDDVIDAARYLLQIKITALEQMIAQSWENKEDGWGTYGAGPNTLKLRDGTAVDVDEQPEGKIEDPEAFRVWCKADPDTCMTCGGAIFGHDEDIKANCWEPHPPKPGGGLERKMQLLWQTMNAIAKERLLAGASAPDGVVMHRRTSVKLRKA